MGKHFFCAPVVLQLRSRCSAIEWSLCCNPAVFALVYLKFF